MEKEISAFITYLHNVKNTSTNTELSYKRDLEKVQHFMAARGIEEAGKVSAQDLSDYVKYLEDNKFAAPLCPEYCLSESFLSFYGTGRNGGGGYLR